MEAVFKQFNVYNVPHSVDTQFNRLIGCQEVRPPLYGQSLFRNPVFWTVDYLRNVPVATVDNDRILREQGYITDFVEERTQGYTDPDEMKKASNA